MDNINEEQPILQSYKYNGKNNCLNFLRYIKLLYLISIELIISIGLNNNKINYKTDIKIFIYLFLMINVLYTILNIVKIINRRVISDKSQTILLVWYFISLLSLLVTCLEPIKKGFLYNSYKIIMIINGSFVIMLIIASIFKFKLIKYKIFLILYDDFIDANIYNYQRIINIMNDATCVICFEEFKECEELRILICQHHFHINCINEWLERNPSCPICRKNILD